ncbi:hypothetical protein INT45_003797 [Circinella minor]|uniref:Uncharacterized protein n=1 Tax=Circinella minor TaxID=1195481 RepID=A0A8H7SF90_9FUNG|nr:hypothetical protein INT45_003797 [Circinella minor]
MSKRKEEINSEKENDDDLNTIELKIAASNKRRKKIEELFIAYDMESIIGKKTAKKEKQLMKQILASEASQNMPKIYDLTGSVGTMIKNVAISKYAGYQDLDLDSRSIICLGLNSILDLSADFPKSQTMLFNKKQWYQLNKLFPPKTFDTEIYNDIKDTLQPILNAYDQRKTMKRNWTAIFKEILSLQSKYNGELNEFFRDIDFCLYFFQSLLLLFKNHDYMFNENIDISEWDFLVKFWGPVLEKLFIGTGLRLKWGDTLLTMKDTSNDNGYKINLRVINDKTVQRYNEESEVTVAEAGKNDPGLSKFVIDRCKLLSENKMIIDNYLHDSDDIDAVYSIQFCGLEMMIVSLSLSANGLYIGNEAYHVQLNNNLQRFPVYLQTVFQLLCFRNEAIGTSNVHNNIKSTSASNRTSVKRHKYTHVIESVPSDNEDEIVSTTSTINNNLPSITPSPKAIVQDQALQELQKILDELDTLQFGMTPHQDKKQEPFSFNELQATVPKQHQQQINQQDKKQDQQEQRKPVEVFSSLPRPPLSSRPQSHQALCEYY